MGVVNPGLMLEDNGNLYKPPKAQFGGSASAAPVGTVGTPAPAPAPPPPAGNVQTAPAYTPDWSNLITHDSAYLAAQASADQAKANAAAQRKQALQQAIVQYGGLPSGFTDQYGDVDQSTLDSAGANQYSVLAGLAKSYTDNQQQFERGLAARGALQSSDLDYGLGQIDNSYGQQRYDAANAVGSQVNSALGAYTGVLSGNAQNLSSALQGAEANVYSNPGYTPQAAQTANYDAGNSATYGQPVYADANGNLFDQNGNPFSPSGASPSAAPGAAAAPSSGGDVYFNPSSGATQLYAPARGIGAWAS